MKAQRFARVPCRLLSSMSAFGRTTQDDDKDEASSAGRSTVSSWLLPGNSTLKTRTSTLPVRIRCFVVFFGRPPRLGTEAATDSPRDFKLLRVRSAMPSMRSSYKDVRPHTPRLRRFSICADASTRSTFANYFSPTSAPICNAHMSTGLCQAISSPKGTRANVSP